MRYRYGFNGKEKDDELKGSGNSYDFGARMYDSRLGRWLSMDPLTCSYPTLSPYVFVSNMPIIAIDPTGREIVIVGDEEFRKNTELYLAQIRATEVGRQIIEVLERSNNVYSISECFFVKDSHTNQAALGKGASIQYDDNPWSPLLDGGAIDGLIALSHELHHAYSVETNSNGIILGRVVSRKRLEQKAVIFQNYMVSVYDLGAFRYKYSGFSWGGEGTFLPGYDEEKDFNPNMEKITNFNHSYTFEFPSVSTDRTGTQGTPADQTNVNRNTSAKGEKINTSYTKELNGKKSNKKESHSTHKHNESHENVRYAN